MRTLGDLAQILRSKNAGPFHLTVDFLFEEKENYDLVKESGVLSSKKVAELYKVKEEDVHIYYFDKANGIKVTIPRLISSGSKNDTDVYGAQQHIMLMNLAI